MPIVVACQCGQRFQARDELAGRQVKCPACGAGLVIKPNGQPRAAGPTHGAQRGGQAAADPLAGYRELTTEELMQLSRKIEVAGVAGPTAAQTPSAQLGVQPTAPQQPQGYPMYAPPPTRRSNRGLLIGGILGGGIGLLVVAGLVVYFAFFRKTEAGPTPVAAATARREEPKPEATKPAEPPKPAETAKPAPATAQPNNNQTQPAKPPEPPPNNPPANAASETPKSEPPPSQKALPAEDSLMAVPFLTRTFYQKDTGIGEADAAAWTEFDGDGYRALFPGKPISGASALRTSQVDINLRADKLYCKLPAVEMSGMAFHICYLFLKETESPESQIEQFVARISADTSLISKKNVSVGEYTGVEVATEHQVNGVVGTTVFRCIASPDTAYVVLVAAAKANYSVVAANKFLESFRVTGARGWQEQKVADLGFSVVGPGRPYVNKDEVPQVSGEHIFPQCTVSFMGQVSGFGVQCYTFPKEYPQTPAQWLAKRLKERQRDKRFQDILMRTSKRRPITLGKYRGEEVWEPTAADANGTPIFEVWRVFVVGNRVYIVDGGDFSEIPNGKLPKDIQRFFDSFKFL